MNCSCLRFIWTEGTPSHPPNWRLIGGLTENQAWWSLYPQRENSPVSLSLGFPAAAHAGFVALEGVLISAVCCRVTKERRCCSCLWGAWHWAAVPWCTDTGGVRPGAGGAGLGNTCVSDLKRQFQQSPGRCHCSCIAVRAQGEGKPFGFCWPLYLPCSRDRTLQSQT